MAQVTIYLPDDFERELKQRAKRARRSLSSLIAELARAQLRPQAWPPEFEKLFGSWEGDFPIPEDPPPDEVRFEVREAKPPRRKR